MKIFITAFFLFISVASYSQQYESAIVTDLNFLRRSNILVTEETFPFYFHHKAFASDVQNEIRLLLFKKYGIKEVLFFTPDSITYRDQPTAWDTQAKEFARGTQRANTLFIEVETILQMYTQIDQELTYRFTTKVRAFDYRGKRVYKFKNHIPFTPVYGDAIAGSMNISEEDFYVFYFDGLRYAFEGKRGVADKRYNIKPMVEQYENFTNSSSKFYLETASDGYHYGRIYNQLSELVYFTINYWSEDGDEPFDFLNLATVDFLDGGYNFINRLDNNEYVVRMKGGINSLKNTFDPFADITWQLLLADGTKKSEVVYDDKSTLKGRYEGVNISFEWKEINSCIEVFIDEEMLALINYSTSSKVLYLSDKITRDQLITIVNCIFMYDYANAVRNKIVFKYN